MTSSSISHAIEVINNFGIIAHQTDTVIGLACLPHKILLQRLHSLKRRDGNKGFILLASSIDHVRRFIDISDSELNQVSESTEKPTTWVVNASRHVPALLLGPSRKVAVRITQHPDIKILCGQVGAIVSTSANLSQQQTCLELNQVRAIFGPRIDFVQQDSTPGVGQSSTIIEASTGKILRQ